MGLLEISFCNGCCCIRYHLLIRISFRSGTVEWYCVMKGKISLQPHTLIMHSLCDSNSYLFWNKVSMTAMHVYLMSRAVRKSFQFISLCCSVVPSSFYKFMFYKSTFSKSSPVQSSSIQSFFCNMPSYELKIPDNQTPDWNGISVDFFNTGDGYRCCLWGRKYQNQREVAGSFSRAEKDLFEDQTKARIIAKPKAKDEFSEQSDVILIIEWVMSLPLSWRLT